MKSLIMSFAAVAACSSSAFASINCSAKAWGPGLPTTKLQFPSHPAESQYFSSYVASANGVTFTVALEKNSGVYYAYIDGLPNGAAINSTIDVNGTGRLDFVPRNGGTILTINCGEYNKP